MAKQPFLDGINLEEAKKLRKDLKLYQDLTKKLGNRGKKIFEKQMNNTHEFVVEYYGSLEQDEILDHAIEVYKKSFHVEPKKEEIILRENKNIKGGMKVYFDDMLVDMSFKKVEKQLSV